MFFWYEKLLIGKWAPCKSSDMPSAKRLTGYSPRMSPVITLTPAEYDESVITLARKYPPPDDAPAFVPVVPKPQGPSDTGTLADDIADKVATGLERHFEKFRK